MTRELAIQSPDRMRVIAHAMRFGFSDVEIYDITRFDPWFLAQIREIIEKNMDRWKMDRWME